MAKNTNMRNGNTTNGGYEKNSSTTNSKNSAGMSNKEQNKTGNAYKNAESKNSSKNCDY